MIKLIASDLDGTLLTDKKELSDATKRVIDLAVRKGICFVPATGRSYESVPDNIKTHPGVEYILTSNGGAIYSTSRRERIYQCMLEEGSVLAALKIKRPKVAALEVFVQGVPYSQEDYVKAPERFGATEYGAKYVKETRIPVKDIDLFAYEHRTELDSMAFICGDMEERAALERRLNQEVPDIYVTSSIGHLLEIGHKNAGKGKTLLYLLERLGISAEEAMAFGDADNDISMLEAVKYGVAVGNGSQDCKKAAAIVTDSNNADGVAKMIEYFMKNDIK